MTYTLARILSASALGVLVTGCATVPGDPYYEPPRYQVYEQPGYIYNAPPPVYQAPPVYRAPGVIYSAPPPAVYYGGRDRDDNRWDNDRNRGTNANNRLATPTAAPANATRPAASRPSATAAPPMIGAIATPGSWPPAATRRIRRTGALASSRTARNSPEPRRRA